MRKWDVPKNVNRNSAIINHFHPNGEHGHTTANVVMNQLWLQDNTAQVEIIELDSDDSEPEQNEGQDFHFDNIWNYLDKDSFLIPQPEFYEANIKARDKRRMHCENSYQEVSPEIPENGNFNASNEMHYSTFYEFTNDLLEKNNSRNHQSNCFTIINKPFQTPESSSDEIEYKERVNTPDHLNVNGSPYDGEIGRFDEDVDSTHTIWIYSFRNKRLLSDNDFELVNIPSEDSASSTSLDNGGNEGTKTKNIRRIPSPIPATYVPRLNLSLAPTLPTVTEITEPTKIVNKETLKPDENKSTQLKCVNNWLDSKVITTNSSKTERDKQDKSSNTNVINWMCLSPRERRRRFKHTSPTYQPMLPVLSECPSSEPKSRSSLTNTDPKKIHTTVEINTIEHKSDTVHTQTSKRNFLTRKTINDEQLSIVDVGGGETDMTGLNLSRRPKIAYNIDRAAIVKITDPIEKLQSNNWIHEETKTEMKPEVSDSEEPEIMELNDLNYQKPDEECAGKKLWVRNMSLLKPVEWSEFMPIAGSVPSLHLSIESESKKQSWFKRLAKFFRCLK